MTPDRVAAASAAWVWRPDDARSVETDDWLLVRYPDWFFTPLVLARFTPRGPVRPAFEAAVEAARTLGWPDLVCWVRLDAPDGWEALLREVAEPVETLDVLALDLAAGPPDLGPVPHDVALRRVDDVDLLRDFETVNTGVFGGRFPDEGHLVAEAGRAARDLAAGTAARVVAHRHGTPVGSAGLTVADGVVRLWGGAVREEDRGRGIYRALLADRIAYGVAHGATLALVKGRVDTSGPILRRAGFTSYGGERSYRVTL